MKLIMENWRRFQKKIINESTKAQPELLTQPLPETHPGFAKLPAAGGLVNRWALEEGYGFLFLKDIKYGIFDGDPPKRIANIVYSDMGSDMWHGVSNLKNEISRWVRSKGSVSVKAKAQIQKDLELLDYIPPVNGRPPVILIQANTPITVKVQADFTEYDDRQNMDLIILKNSEGVGPGVRAGAFVQLKEPSSNSAMNYTNISNWPSINETEMYPGSLTYFEDIVSSIASRPERGGIVYPSELPGSN